MTIETLRAAIKTLADRRGALQERADDPSVSDADAEAALAEDAAIARHQQVLQSAVTQTLKSIPLAQPSEVAAALALAGH